ncbi:MAG: ABC transporter permease, partial [Bacteroidota bacterium]
MNFPLLVARRYFLSKKKKNFINVIAIISMLVVAVGTAALIISLSVYNGLEDVLKNVHSNFDPDLKVVPVKGKSFGDSTIELQALRKIDGIRDLSPVIENKALIKFKNSQKFVTVKGVEQSYFETHKMGNLIIEKEYQLEKGKTSYLIMGIGVKYQLDVGADANVIPISLYYPKNITKLTVRKDQLYNIKSVLLGGTFALERQYDEHYVFLSTNSARELFSYEGRYSYLEVNIDDEADRS